MGLERFNNNIKYLLSTHYVLDAGDLMAKKTEDPDLTKCTILSAYVCGGCSSWN